MNMLYPLAKYIVSTAFPVNPFMIHRQIGQTHGIS